MPAGVQTCLSNRLQELVLYVVVALWATVIRLPGCLVAMWCRDRSMADTRLLLLQKKKHPKLWIRIPTAFTWAQAHDAIYEQALKYFVNVKNGIRY